MSSGQYFKSNIHSVRDPEAVPGRFLRKVHGCVTVMYGNYFGFIEGPFNPTPDSKFFYPSKEHEDTLSRPVYTIDERRGFAVITGKIGTGKTTICRTLLNRLDANTGSVIINNTFLNGKQLIMMILEDPGIDAYYHISPLSEREGIQEYDEM